MDGVNSNFCFDDYLLSFFEEDTARKHLVVGLTELLKGVVYTLQTSCQTTLKSHKSTKKTNGQKEPTRWMYPVK